VACLQRRLKEVEDMIETEKKKHQLLTTKKNLRTEKRLSALAFEQLPFHGEDPNNI